MLDERNRTTGLLMGPLTLDETLELPYMLAPDIALDVATADEQSMLKESFDRLYADLMPTSSPSKAVFESDWAVSATRDGFETNSQNLDPEKYRYFVVRTGGESIQPQSKRLDDLDLILQLHIPSLVITAVLGDGEGPGVIGRYTKRGRRSSSIRMVTEMVTASGVASLNDDHLLGIRRDLQLFDLLHPVRHLRILRSLEMMSDASVVHLGNPLHTLGNFVSLECLLTHRPSPGDPNDSISRQLRRSVPLLLNRAGCLDDFNKWMGVGKLISKLYEIRSALAHGQPISEAMPPGLSQHGSFSDVVDLTLSMLRALLRQSLLEPDLAVDLCGD